MSSLSWSSSTTAGTSVVRQESEKQQAVQDLQLQVETLSTTIAELYASVAGQAKQVTTLAHSVEQQASSLQCWAQLIQAGRGCASGRGRYTHSQTATQSHYIQLDSDSE
jgi:hypothetical protein